MKKLVFLTAALVVTISTLAVADEVVIVGNRTDTNVCPWWGLGHPAIRFMALWEKSEIPLKLLGYINKVEFLRSSSTTGTFNSVRAYFGHSAKTALEPKFADNYLDTPVQVLDARSKTVSGSSGQWWDLGITADTFMYNNANNLVLEIRWRGSTGVNCWCWRGSGGQKRMWAFDDAATIAVARPDDQIQYLRLTFANATSVAPTSLGRVKSLFR